MTSTAATSITLRDIREAMDKLPLNLGRPPFDHIRACKGEVERQIAEAGLDLVVNTTRRGTMEFMGLPVVEVDNMPTGYIALCRKVPGGYGLGFEVVKIIGPKKPA